MIYAPDTPVESGTLDKLGGLTTAFLCPLLLMSICIIVFIFENSSFWEVISSYILDILDSMVNADDSVIPEAKDEAPGYNIALGRPEPQVSILSSAFSMRRNGGGFVNL